MNLINFESQLSQLLNTLNYKLFFGTKTLYNSIKKDVSPKDIIIEPFSMKVDRENISYYDTSLTIWVMVRTSINNPLESPNSGKNVEFMQYMLNEIKLIFDLINDSQFMYITKKLNTIPIQYYDNETINNQIMVRATLPVRIYL